MNLVEVWRQAKPGERIRRRGRVPIAVPDPQYPWWMETRPDDLESDDWEIAGRWPVPTEPGWYWFREIGSLPCVVSVRRRTDGELVASQIYEQTLLLRELAGTWGPRVEPPEEWR